MAFQQKKEYDVIIIGTGPAGIFTVLEIIQGTDSNLEVLMIDSGDPIQKRIQNRKNEKKDIMRGWGGAGSFSDGKLTLTTEIGGILSRYIPLTTLERYVKEVEHIYIKFGAPKERLVYGDCNKVEEVRKKALQFGISLIPYRLLHIGTDQCANVLTAMYDYITSSSNIAIHFKETAEQVLVTNNRITGVKTSNCTYRAKCVVAATGRSGAAWMRKEALRLGLSVENNPVDIGVRVEIPAELSSHLTNLLHEFKCRYYSPTFDQECRTFCVCPNGEVTEEVVIDPETNERWITVNGHSYANIKKATANTNFAILISSKFTEPFDDPLAYGRSICKLANLLTNGSVIVQRLVDLKKGRRSNYERIQRSSIEPSLKAVPGDLSFVLPYRHLCSILEMIEVLDNIIPGVNSNNTLLYGVETKYYSNLIKLTQNLETKINGFYAIGDGAGLTRSLVQASVSGLVAARSIKKKYQNQI